METRTETGQLAMKELEAKHIAWYAIRNFFVRGPAAIPSDQEHTVAASSISGDISARDWGRLALELDVKSNREGTMKLARKDLAQAARLGLSEVLQTKALAARPEGYHRTKRKEENGPLQM